MKRGFTLIEVVMALAIFAMAMVILVGFNERGYINDGKARHLSIAVGLARTKMTDLQLDVEKEVALGAFPDDKSEDGEFEKPYDDYRWKMEIRKVELPIPPLGDTASDANKQIMDMMTKQISDSVRELKLTIFWKEMSVDKSFSVTTHIAKL